MCSAFSPILFCLLLSFHSFILIFFLLSVQYHDPHGLRSWCGRIKISKNADSASAEGWGNVSSTANISPDATKRASGLDIRRRWLDMPLFHYRTDTDTDTKLVLDWWRCIVSAAGSISCCCKFAILWRHNRPLLLWTHPCVTTYCGASQPKIHVTGPSRPIRCSSKVWFRRCLTVRIKWGGASSCMNPHLMPLITRLMF
jgi:hypothetical protein